MQRKCIPPYGFGLAHCNLLRLRTSVAAGAAVCGLILVMPLRRYGADRAKALAAAAD